MLSNPVLHKELLRLRMRQGKPVRIAILTAVALGMAYFYLLSAAYLLNPLNRSDIVNIWALVVGAQFLIITLITPSATVNAISQEREQQTWELLVQTRLTGKEIIFGKLFARLVPTLALILLGLPITTMCLFAAQHPIEGYSGTLALTPGIFLITHGAMLIMGLFFATFGLYMSMRFKRTLYALLATYCFVIGVLGIGTTLITGTLGMFDPYNSHFVERFPLMWVNPGYIIGAIISGNGNSANGREDFAFAFIGLLCYAGATAFLLARLVTRFHKMAIDR